MERVTPPGHGSLAPPAFATQSEYAARLSDVAFWAPYVHAALARHSLPARQPRAGAGGTFPTFLVGTYVVKLFPDLLFGPTCHAAEVDVHRLLLAHPEIPAARLIADGALFTHGWPWPYLITTRLAGSAWRRTAPRCAEQPRVAREIGRAIRQAHDLPAPGGPLWERDWLASLRTSCVDRHRRWGTLPDHLVHQIDSFLAPPSPLRRVIHADLHDDHVFVSRGHLVGIIDWSDALLADPYYELPALHLHTFRARRPLLEAFPDAYGWQVGADFAGRAMTMTLLHEFNPLGRAQQYMDIAAATTLEALAESLWRLG